MKKILYLITQSELGGAQRYVFDLANNLKSEFDITVAFGEPGENGELARMLKENNIEYFVLPHLKRRISPINDFIALKEIIDLFKKLQPDIIHLNSSKISILGSLAAYYNSKLKIKNSKIIYTVHGWVFNEPQPVWLKQFYFWSEKITAHFKDKLICVSEFDRQIALEKRIANENKLITIHNGLGEAEFLARFDARRQLVTTFNIKIEPDDILLGSIGNLYKTKGYEYLIKALKILAENNLKFKAVIIGGGKEKNALNKIIQEYNLTGKVFLLGGIDNAGKYLNAFDVFISSSVKEGLSYTILEAMRAGIPIIATEVGGTPEMIEDGQTGLLVKPEDHQALADGIVKLTSHNVLREKLGTNAKMKAETNFTSEEMINKTKEVYLT